MTKIKICGIKQPELAYAAARAGADFIGLVFVPSSQRAVTLQMAQIISDAARAGGAEPVAVFATATAATMLSICQNLDIHWVQLHGNGSQEEQHLLPDYLHRIYAQPVSPQGAFQFGPVVNTLNPHRDYLLFDSQKAGSGKTFNWSNFAYQGELPWFLSGGLNAENVGKAIQLLRPNVVDVSSGVEDLKGEKNLELIIEFIQVIRCLENNLLLSHPAVYPMPSSRDISPTSSRDISSTSSRDLIAGSKKRL